MVRLIVTEHEEASPDPIPIWMLPVCALAAVAIGSGLCWFIDRILTFIFAATHGWRP